jgi:hypothetical protein
VLPQIKWPGGLHEPGGGCQSGNGELRGQFYSSLTVTPVLSSELSQEAGALRTTDRYGVSDAAVQFSFP